MLYPSGMEIQFYHLLTTPLEVALPQLLPKVLAGGFKAVLKCRDDAQVKLLDEAIWTQDANSFIPHGTASELLADQQPLLLSLAFERMNDAKLLMVLDGSTVPEEAQQGYERMVDMFDGSSEPSLTAARERWKVYKAAEHTLTYYKQQSNGGWKKEG